MEAVIPRKNYSRQIQTYVLLTILVLALASFYGYFQFQKLAASQAALTEGQALVPKLQSTSNQLSQNYATLTETYDQTFQSVRQAIESVYPSEEQYTKLTQTLDDFINKTNTRFNPIFMSDIKFAKARYDQQKGNAVLPFSLTLTTTKDNFEKFLQYVEDSGSLNTGTRLIDIRAISINFGAAEQPAFLTTETGQSVELINVSVSLNAYFQPSTEMQTSSKKTEKK